MSLIIKEIDNHIAWLTVNRPNALNAMNEDAINELESAVKSSINDDSVGVIIITGSGEKAFIAGADIKKMQKMSSEEALVFG
ncbi:MAG: enoyl-CoA hydratase/isomerase family protein, partial [Candidatus Neomarinimicrobiota bacterium]|nr:enoyl-CoA hydratase/isomerase family protein [Candidatus Neomarinimicrobiota bacterium]